jgi:serine/threonine-protein kinase
MASVWVARQIGSHGFRKLVALKTILPRYASEPKFQRMFIDEARIASRIDHVNVAQILDVGDKNEATYLVMELVDGDSLHRLNRAAEKKGLSVPAGVVLRVMAEVCAGLHAAHELRDDDGQLLGVIHRDVSPQNVLINSKGVAKLIDFGIAKAKDRLSGDTTSSGTLKGKVRYMAPEQALGRPMDRRVDVWAVGAVLYHLLAGKPPYEADSEVATLAMLSNGRPPAPLPEGIHPAVADVVRRALVMDPEGRFATTADVQQALEAAIVAAGLTEGATAGAVAGFVAEVMGEQAEKRREAIAVGLKAAGESGPFPAAAPPAESPSAPGKTLGSMAHTLLPSARRPGFKVAMAVLAVGVALGLAGLLALFSATRTAPAAAPPLVANTSAEAEIPPPPPIAPTATEASGSATAASAPTSAAPPRSRSNAHPPPRASPQAPPTTTLPNRRYDYGF